MASVLNMGSQGSQLTDGVANAQCSHLFPTSLLCIKLSEPLRHSLADKYILVSDDHLKLHLFVLLLILFLQYILNNHYFFFYLLFVWGFHVKFVKISNWRQKPAGLTHCWILNCLNLLHFVCYQYHIKSPTSF